MFAYLLTYNCKNEVRNSAIILSTIFALLISFSRPYLGVHYLSDILGGIILSIPILLMLINVINKNYSKKISRK
jgi:membrane-associated phospholipid phosphatase